METPRIILVGSSRVGKTQTLWHLHGQVKRSVKEIAETEPPQVEDEYDQLVVLFERYHDRLISMTRQLLATGRTRPKYGPVPQCKILDIDQLQLVIDHATKPSGVHYAHQLIVANCHMCYDDKLRLKFTAPGIFSCRWEKADGKIYLDSLVDKTDWIIENCLAAIVKYDPLHKDRSVYIAQTLAILKYAIIKLGKKICAQLRLLIKKSYPGMVRDLRTFYRGIVRFLFKNMEADADDQYVLLYGSVKQNWFINKQYYGYDKTGNYYLLKYTD